jgi:uncharacterized membrane protein
VGAREAAEYAGEAAVQYLAAFLLLAMLVAEGAVIVLTTGQLPPHVASHFDGQGFANAFMLRTDYQLLMMGLGLGIPLLIVLGLVVLPYLLPNRLRIPSRDYWMEPARRSQTLSTIATSGLVIASIVAAFMIAMQLLVVEANNRVPPQLDNALLYTLIALLIIAMLVWQLILWRRFQVPR